MQLSCGIIILNENNEVLLGHVTGAKHWDIPKGGADEGETPLQAALRETWEETGLKLSPLTLQDLGKSAYMPTKQLHLYLARVLRRDIDPDSLHCASTFDHPRRGPLPEVDRFAWVPLNRLGAYCTARMTSVLHTLLSPVR